MIDPPPAGGAIRIRDLVVESRMQDHWAIAVIPGTKNLTLGPVDFFGPSNRQFPCFFDFGKVEF